MARLFTASQHEITQLAQAEAAAGRPLPPDEIQRRIQETYTSAIRAMQQNMPGASNAAPQINFQGAQQMLAVSGQFMPPQVGQQLNQELQTARELLTRYLHPNNMPAQVRQQFDAAMQHLGRAGLLAQPPQREDPPWVPVGMRPGPTFVGPPVPPPQPHQQAPWYMRDWSGNPSLFGRMAGYTNPPPPQARPISPQAQQLMNSLLQTQPAPRQ